VGSGLHKYVASDEIHAPYFRVYADETERLADTGFIASDVNRKALQESDNTEWILSNHSPITWQQVGGAGTDPDAIHDNVSGEINAISEKASPVGADLIVIEDSADSYNKKKAQITNLPTGSDADAIHDNVSGEIAAVTEKTTPVGADLLLIEDSEATNAKKRLQVTNLPVPAVEDEFTPTNGQVTFILSQTPKNPASLQFLVNGVTADDGDDYTLSGTTITWLNNLFTMETTDKVLARYS